MPQAPRRRAPRANRRPGPGALQAGPRRRQPEADRRSAQTEVELKFLVPRATRAALAAEMTRGSATLERRSLKAIYLDTDDRRLARAGIAWRLRREGRRWIQTLKAGGANPLERFEHEVIRADMTHDAAEHAGTPAGERLLEILRDAHVDGVDVRVRFRTDVRRTARRIRTRGAVVEVDFDEGRLLAADANERIREVEFELVSGSTAAMLALAERWRRRFALVYDPRSKAERGDRLAEGSAFPPVRKAARPAYSADASAAEALACVLDECLSQITRNAIGLIEGDPGLRVGHVHQLRVGIRRLRSALRSFDGWAPAPPVALLDDLRTLFATLGMARDSDVLDSGVVAALAEAGAPALAIGSGTPGPDPADAVRADGVQRLFLSWLAWRVALADAQPAEVQPAEVQRAEVQRAEVQRAEAQRAEVQRAKAQRAQAQPSDAHPDAQPGAGDEVKTAGAALPSLGVDASDFHRNAERRLRRWHRRIAGDAKVFDEFDELALHSLRKRIKRQRYAVEFFAPVLRRRSVERYLKPLETIQDRMGELNDLFVARTRYQALVATDPAAWFALGWLAARVAELRALARPELQRFAKTDPPTR